MCAMMMSKRSGCDGGYDHGHGFALCLLHAVRAWPDNPSAAVSQCARHIVWCGRCVDGAGCAGRAAEACGSIIGGCRAPAATPEDAAAELQGPPECPTIRGCVGSRRAICAVAGAHCAACQVTTTPTCTLARLLAPPHQASNGTNGKGHEAWRAQLEQQRQELKELKTSLNSGQFVGGERARVVEPGVVNTRTPTPHTHFASTTTAESRMYVWGCHDLCRRGSVMGSSANGLPSGNHMYSPADIRFFIGGGQQRRLIALHCSVITCSLSETPCHQVWVGTKFLSFVVVLPMRRVRRRQLRDQRARECGRTAPHFLASFALGQP